MYRNCIFCSADLGGNDALETFPVGGKLAFDGHRGRLWAVCPACARWNLAPIEERWEAVEDAERSFAGARLRVQSENIGMAQLSDGTRLVRVGAALPGELAAWRYGGQLLRRRRRYLVAGGVGIAAAAAVFGGLAAAGVGTTFLWIGSTVVDEHRKQRIVHRLGADAEIEGHRPSGEIIIRRWQLEGLGLEADGAGGPAVVVRDYPREKPGWKGRVDPASKDVILVRGGSARALLGRAMVHVNRAGATEAALAEANRLLGDAGSAERVLNSAAREGLALGKRAGREPHLLRGPLALAFEMALNEASEQRALEGELAALEAAWREAEEIAAIADALPGSETLNRLFQQLIDRGARRG